MKHTVIIEDEDAFNWAYENDLSLVDWEMSEYLCYNDLWDESYSPLEVEVEFDVIAESSTSHPYGSTYAVERHPAEINYAEVDDKPVTVPEWLEHELIELVEEY